MQGTLFYRRIGEAMQCTLFHRPVRMLTGGVVVALILVTSGCSSFELESGAMCNNLEKGAGSHSQTVHGSFWGFKWKEPVVEKCEDGCGLFRVEYHTNALFILASVATLGLYVPQTVEWWCAVEPRDDSDTKPFNPNSSGRTQNGQAQSGEKPVGEGRAP